MLDVPSVFLPKPFFAAPRIPRPLTPAMEARLTAKQMRFLKQEEDLLEIADFTLRSSLAGRNAFAIGESSDGVMPVAAALWRDGCITLWSLCVMSEHWDAAWFQRELDSLSSTDCECCA